MPVEGVPESGRANSYAILQMRRPRFPVARQPALGPKAAGGLATVNCCAFSLSSPSGIRGSGPTSTYADTVGQDGTRSPPLTPAADPPTKQNLKPLTDRDLPTLAQRPPNAQPWWHPAQASLLGEVLGPKPSAPGFTSISLLPLSKPGLRAPVTGAQPPTGTPPSAEGTAWARSRPSTLQTLAQQDPHQPVRPSEPP